MPLCWKSCVAAHIQLEAQEINAFLKQASWRRHFYSTLGLRLNKANPACSSTETSQYILCNILLKYLKGNFPLKTRITTKAVCFNRLLKCLKVSPTNSVNPDQDGPVGISDLGSQCLSLYQMKADRIFRLFLPAL